MREGKEERGKSRFGFHEGETLLKLAGNDG